MNMPIIVGTCALPSICNMHAVADTGFEKGGGALTPNFQINGFLP